MQGYLRDLTQEDIAFLQPYTGSLLSDPILLCPPLGFDDAVLIAEQSQAGAPSSVKTAATADVPAAEVTKLNLMNKHLLLLHAYPMRRARRKQGSQAWITPPQQSCIAAVARPLEAYTLLNLAF